MEKEHKCNLCGECFASKRKLVGHKRSHVKSKPFVCSTCDQGFSESRQLTAHTQIHTGVRPHVCWTCDERFLLERQLESHINSVHKNGKTVCELCNKGFTNKTFLRIHIRAVHNKEKPFVCELCKRAFETQVHLDLHIIGMHKKRNFVCEFCKKSFKLKRDLHQHMIHMHISSKKYTCGICSKVYACKEYLDRHLTVHTRPYKCNVFSKSSVKETMLEHVHVDTKDKSFSCDVCRTAFSQKLDFVKHLETHEDGIKSYCQVCKTLFPTKEDLTKHMGVHLNPSNHIQDLNPKDQQSSSEIHEVNLAGEMEEVCCESFVENEGIAQGIGVEVFIKEEESDLQDSVRIIRSENESEKKVKKFKKASFKEGALNLNTNTTQCIVQVHNADTEEKDMEEDEHVKVLDEARHIENFVGKVEVVCDDSVEVIEVGRQFNGRDRSVEKLEMFSESVQEDEVGCKTIENMKVVPETPENLKENFVLYEVSKSSLDEEVQTGKNTFSDGDVQIVEGDIVCEICAKTFYSEANLEAHMKLHRIIYVCVICSKTFSQKKCLLDHVSIHQKEKSYACKVCNKQFQNELILTAHMQVHTYSCNVCSQGFSTKGLLTKHMAEHFKEKTVLLETYRKRNLTTHMKTHTKQFFKCEICNQAFLERAQLEEHKKMHAVIPVGQVQYLLVGLPVLVIQK